MAEANDNQVLDFGLALFEEDTPDNAPDESLEDEVDTEEEVEEEEVSDDEGDEEYEDDDDDVDEDDEEPEPEVSKSEQKRRKSQAKADKLQSDLEKSNAQLVAEQNLRYQMEQRLSAIENESNQKKRQLEEAEDAKLTDWGDDDEELVTVGSLKNLKKSIARQAERANPVAPVAAQQGPSVYDQQRAALMQQPDINQVSQWAKDNPARMKSLDIPEHELTSQYHAVKYIMAQEVNKKAKAKTKKAIPRTGGAPVSRGRGKKKNDFDDSLSRVFGAPTDGFGIPK